MNDPFGLFDLAPALTIDAAALERAYLTKSRDCHPDRHTTADAETQAAALEASARLNDAYRVLRDRWRRAEHLLERTQPGVVEATKKLDPEFLMTAMELAEEVEEARGEERTALRDRCAAEVESLWGAIETAFAADRPDDAAVAFHRASYFRKALADLAD